MTIIIRENRMRHGILRKTVIHNLSASIVFSSILNATAQDYGFEVWTKANGLPQNTVTGLAQVRDGYLWLSTFDGLARSTACGSEFL